MKELLKVNPIVDDSSYKKQRAIRLFISSTFKDMEEEREELVKYIFPKLRKLCEERGVTWNEIDLRWGVTNEQTADGKVLPICLVEIEKCRPFFIGILGDRYGWIPKIPEQLIQENPWLESYRDRSVTELEMLHGALLHLDKNVNAYFYFRQPISLDRLSAEEREKFEESVSQEELENFNAEDVQTFVKNKQEKLENLKDFIRESGYKVREDFKGSKDLGELVYEDFSKLIEDIFPKHEEADEHERKNQEHESYAMTRSKYFVGREEYIEMLDEHVEADGAPLVITGESGLGKSALLSYWAINHVNKNGKDSHPLIMHFIGATPYSSDSTILMKRIMMEFIKLYQFEIEVPNNPEKLREEFTRCLDLASEKRKHVIILDAINQLNNSAGTTDLFWLPTKIPANIRLIVSTTKCEYLHDLRERKWNVLELTPLNDQERKQFITEYLSAFGKNLEGSIIDTISNKPQAKNPLFLRTILEEIRVYGNHFNLIDKVEEYVSATSIDDLFSKKLKRIETDYSRERENLVKDALLLLWGSRRGLSESELLDLLGSSDKKLASSIWSPLYLAIESNLTNHLGYVYLFHDYFRKAIETRYIHDEKEKYQIHLTLANYFSNESINNARIMQELPWQLAQAKEWDRLYTLLGDLEFTSVLFDHDPYEVKQYWTLIEENTKHWRSHRVEELTMLKAYSRFIETPQNYELDHIRLVALLLEDKYPNEALQLQNYIKTYFEQTHNLDGLLKCMSHISKLLFVKGSYQESMNLLIEQEKLAIENNALEVIQENLGIQANIHIRWANNDEAMALLKEQERICSEEIHHKFGLQQSLGKQAEIFTIQREYDKALDLLSQKERICIQTNNKDGLQEAIGQKAVIVRSQYQDAEALNLLQIQEDICRSIGKMKSLQECLANQTLILLSLSRIDECVALLREQELICRYLNHKDGLQSVYGLWAKVMMQSKKLASSLNMLKKQERICRELGSKIALQECLGRQANIYVKERDFATALTILKEVEEICSETDYFMGLQVNLGLKAMIFRFQGRIRESLDIIEEQLAICREINTHKGTFYALTNKAWVLCRMGKLEEALALYKEQEFISRSIDQHKNTAKALYEQANIYSILGDQQKALELLQQSEEISLRISDKQSIYHIENKKEYIHDILEGTASLEVIDSNDFRTISPVEQKILDYINQNETTTFGDLQNGISDMNQSKLSSLIDRLTTKALIYSVRKTIDKKKRSILYLTDIGQEKVGDSRLDVSADTVKVDEKNSTVQADVIETPNMEHDGELLESVGFETSIEIVRENRSLIKLKDDKGERFVVVVSMQNIDGFTEQLDLISELTNDYHIIAMNELILHSTVMPHFYRWLKNKYGNISVVKDLITIHISHLKKLHVDNEDSWKMLKL